MNTNQVILCAFVEVLCILRLVRVSILKAFGVRVNCVHYSNFN